MADETPARSLSPKAEHYLDALEMIDGIWLSLTDEEQEQITGIRSILAAGAPPDGSEAAFWKRAASRRGSYIAALKRKGFAARAALVNRSMNPLRKISAALEALQGFGPEGVAAKESSKDIATPEGAPNLPTDSGPGGPHFEGASPPKDTATPGPGATHGYRCFRCTEQFFDPEAFFLHLKDRHSR